MFSKFSVLSKLCKHSYFKRYGLLHISRFYSMPTHKLSRNANRLLVLHEYINQKDFCTPILLDSVPKRNYCIKFIRNMSSIGKDGDEVDKSTPNENADKKKKDVIQRRWKVKRLKTVKVKCKRCKKLHVNKTEVEKPRTNETVLKKDLNVLKAEPARVTNDEGISQSHLPPKKLHVEFMESQNLKDFNLNKDQPNNTLNKKPNVIDIKIFPVKVSDEKSSLNFFQMVAKNSLPALKPKSAENSNKNAENLPLLANVKNPDINSITGSSSDLAQQKVNTNIPHEMKPKSLSDLTFQFQVSENKASLPSEKPKKLIYDPNEISRPDHTIKLNIAKSDILTEERKLSSAKELKDNALIKPNSKDSLNPKSNVESSSNKYSDLPKVSSSNQNILHEEKTSREQDTSLRKTKEIRILYQARPKKKIAKTKYKKNLQKILNPKFEQKNPSSNISKETEEFYTKGSKLKFEDIEAKALKRKKNRAKWLKTKKSATNLNMFTTPLEEKSEQSKAIDSVIKTNDQKEEASKNNSISYPTAFGDTSTLNAAKSNKDTKTLPNIVDTSTFKTAAVKQELSKSTSTDKNEVRPGVTNSPVTKASPNIADTTALKTEAVKPELNTNTSSAKNEVKQGLTNFTEQLSQKQIKTNEKEEYKKTLTKGSEKVSGSEAKKIPVNPSTFKKQIDGNKFQKGAEAILKEVKNQKLKTKEEIAGNKFQKAAKTVLKDIKNQKLKIKEEMQAHKVLGKSQSPLKAKNTTNPLKTDVSTNWPKNMFGEYMSPEKLKQVEEKLKFINGTPQASSARKRNSQSQSQSNILGTTNLRTTKAAKFKPYSRGGSNRGGGNRGDDGGDNDNKKCDAMAEKAAPSRFWRNLSLSVLPILIAVTVYLFSSAEAINMLTRMHLTSTKDPFDIKVLPAFYETDSESDNLNPQPDDENINENDADSEAVEVENVRESETNNLFEDHRLDEA